MKKEKIKNRGFGILFFLVFLLIGLYPIYKGLTPNLYLVILSIPFLILGLINSKILTPLNKAWMRFGLALGWVNSRIILGLVFIIVLQPIALIMRMFGYDPLRKKRDNKRSYREIKENHNTNLTTIF